MKSVSTIAYYTPGSNEGQYCDLRVTVWSSSMYDQREEPNNKEVHSDLMLPDDVIHNVMPQVDYTAASDLAISRVFAGYPNIKELRVPWSEPPEDSLLVQNIRDRVRYSPVGAQLGTDRFHLDTLLYTLSTKDTP